MWTWLRASIRGRLRLTVVLVAFTGLAFGATVAALAGARRTDTAVSRLLEVTNANDAVFVGEERYFGEVERLPQVSSSAPRVFMALAPRSVDGRHVNSVNVATFAALSEPGTPHGAPGALTIAGRFADSSRADEVVVNESAASHLGVHVGSQMSFASFGPGQLDDFLQRDVVPAGPTVIANVVGIVRNGGDLSAIEAPVDAAYVGSDLVAFTKAFFDEHSSDVGHFRVVMYVRFRDGAGAFESWAASVEQLTGDRSTVGPGSDERTVAAEAQRSAHVQAEALYLFAVILGMAALFVIGQAVSREIGREARDKNTLAALGFTSQRLRIALLGRPATIAAAGGLLAVPIAVALSGLTPIGLARKAEPRPGLDSNVLLIVTVTSALVAVLMGRSFLSVRRFARSGVGATSHRRPSATRRSLASSTRALSPSAWVGVGFAYDRRDGAPGLTTVVGLVISATAIIASSVFGSSLRHFSASPSQQGWAWDVEVGNPHTQIDTRDEAVPFLTTAPSVASFVGITGEPSGSALVNETFSAIVGFDDSPDHIGPPALTGRVPSAAHEVAMGARTMQATRTRIGDEVTIEGDAGKATYRVVGTVVLSPLITNSQIHLGEGLMVTLDGLRRITSSPLVNQYLISLRSDVPRQGALAALRSQFPSAVVPFFRAADVENLWRVRSLPSLLALLLVLLALGTLAHSLIASVRDRRRDLATLAALGFTRRQLSRVVRWQAAALVTPAIVVAVPLGIVAGRVAWQGIAHQLGVRAPAVLPGVELGLGMIGLALLVAALAMLPGRRAARGDAAAALRSDARG